MLMELHHAWDEVVEQLNMQAAIYGLIGIELVKHYPKYIEQDAKQEPSSQFAELARSGLKACSSSNELRGLSARAQMGV